MILKKYCQSLFDILSQENSLHELITPALGALQVNIYSSTKGHTPEIISHTRLLSSDSAILANLLRPGDA